MVDRISPKQTESERPRSAVDVVEAGSRSDPGALLDADVSAEAILAVNPDAVLGVDSGGTIRIANRAAAEQFGYTLDQLVGGSIDRLLPASVRHRHRPLMQGFFTEPASRPMGAGCRCRRCAETVRCSSWTSAWRRSKREPVGRSR